jgi:hypothetical protein
MLTAPEQRSAGRAVESLPHPKPIATDAAIVEFAALCWDGVRKRGSDGE